MLGTALLPGSGEDGRMAADSALSLPALRAEIDGRRSARPGPSGVGVLGLEPVTSKGRAFHVAPRRHGRGRFRCWRTRSRLLAVSGFAARRTTAVSPVMPGHDRYFVLQ